jgi:hypothetical protein
MRIVVAHSDQSIVVVQTLSHGMIEHNVPISVVIRQTRLIREMKVAMQLRVQLTIVSEGDHTIHL